MANHTDNAGDNYLQNTLYCFIAVSASGLYLAPGAFIWLLMSAGAIGLLTMSSHRAFAVAAETREKSLQKASYMCSDIR